MQWWPVTSVPFRSLSLQDKRDALQVAASLSGRRAHLLEKDFWVVETLAALFSSPFGTALTFKGGTSLSKGYQAISRFSEDLDITYDIRAIASDLVAGKGEDALPATRSQERRWTREITDRLLIWVEAYALPTIQTGLADAGLSFLSRVEGNCLFVSYSPLFVDYGFVRPEVTVEFGGRSTGEPREERLAECDAAPYLPDVSFPSTKTFVMLAERTFWEKATAAHVFCLQERNRGERLSRHWYDLVRLDEAGYAERALSNRDIALSVARHKSAFFREKDAEGSWIDYAAAVSGKLQLVPEGNVYDVLADDYHRMVSGGMLFNDEEPFDDLMERCADIQRRANGH